MLTSDFTKVLNDGSRDIYNQIIKVVKKTKDIFLDKDFAVHISSYDTETWGMYYPKGKGQKSDERIFRTYLP